MSASPNSGMYAYAYFPAYEADMALVDVADMYPIVMQHRENEDVPLFGDFNADEIRAIILHQQEHN